VLFDRPDWGPIATESPTIHPVGNSSCVAHATQGGVFFEGGRIEALIRCGGEFLSTSRAEATRFGLAQVRRSLELSSLAAEHLIFAPLRPRPLLLALVRLLNKGDRPVVVDYTETWAVSGSEVREAAGACLCNTPEGQRALADAGLVVRGRAPDPLPTAGLAIDLRLPLPPGEPRQLCFAYAAPDSGNEAAPLVRGWRGGAEAELGRTVAAWIERLGGEEDLIAAYRGKLTELQLGPD
jgi:hypothetical protein